MIKAIVAVDEKWGIGKKNDLLFRLPLDMKYFREKTLGKTVCMGYNTLLSFPEGKPLKNRKNIVLCPEGIERDDLLCLRLSETKRTTFTLSAGRIFTEACCRIATKFS